MEGFSRFGRFKHVTPQQVIFRDIDYFHHANNAAYSTWTETARMRYMADVVGVGGLEEMKIVLGTINIRFVSPALYGEQLEVGTRAGWLGAKSFSLEHEIRAATGRLIAVVETIQVAYDHELGRSVPIPEDWRRLIEEFEARPLARDMGGDQALS